MNEQTITDSEFRFRLWLETLDKVLSAQYGLGYGDLPDCCYRDWFEDGVSPRGAARRAVRAARGLDD